MKKKKDLFTIYVVTGALVLLSFWLVYPFLNVLFFAALLAYISYPLFNFFAHRTNNKGLSALLTTILILTIVFVPLSIMLNSLASETVDTYNLIKTKQYQQYIEKINCENNQLCALPAYTATLLEDERIQQVAIEITKKISNESLKLASGFVRAIPSAVLSFFMLLFLLYYFIKDQKKIMKGLSAYLMMKKKHVLLLAKTGKGMIDAVIYGYIVLSFAQAIIGVIGFYLFQVPFPWLFGLAMFVLGLIPFLGATVVWVPIVLIKTAVSVILQDSTGIILSIGLAAYMFFTVTAIDNFVRPKIIGDRAHVHPVTVLVGVIGGIHTMGLLGIFGGPLILVLTHNMLMIIQEERR